MPSEILFILILSGPPVLLIGVFVVLQLYHNRKMERLATPIYEHIVEKAQKRANEIIGAAMDDARTVRVQGELSSMKAATQNEAETKKILSEYEESLEELTDQTKAYIKKRGEEVVQSYEELSTTFTTEAQEEFASIRERFRASSKEVEQALGDLTGMISQAKASQQQAEDQVHQQLNQRLQKLVAGFDERLTKTWKQLEQNISDTHHKLETDLLERIRTALQQAEEEVAHYKRSRQNIIDKDIAGVVEHITAEVLGKRLTIDEHVEFAKRAFTDAGSQGTFQEGTHNTGETTVPNKKQ